MRVEVSIDIQQHIEAVWAAITDIEHAVDRISGIQVLEVLEKPASGLVGLKWKETREMFGQSSTETMWVTEAVDCQYYCVRAESHGSIYLSKLQVSAHSQGTTLTMSFSAQAQTVMAKIMSFIMGPMIKGSMKKELLKDLTDIKNSFV